MNIEISDKLYQDLLAYLQKIYHGNDVSGFVDQLIFKELRDRCWIGYELDRLTQCKTAAQLSRYINLATFGTGWDDFSLYEERFLCLDIDNFKHYLDIYGMTDADLILVKIADSLREIYDTEDIFRMGADDFIVVLGDKTVIIPDIHPDIQLKYSVVSVSVRKNQRRNHHINGEIELFLDKGLIYSSVTGNKINLSTP